MKKRMKFFLIGGIIFILIIVLVMAANSYRVTTTTPQFINEHSNPKCVNNGGSYDIFVPTKTSTEWSSFYSNAPTGITLGECCSAVDCSTVYPSCGQLMDCFSGNCCLDKDLPDINCPIGCPQ